jgi:methylglutaconyl-CoA hydratase
MKEQIESYNHIEVTVDQAIATIWLNRPQVHNALHGEMLAELTACFEKLNCPNDVRIIVLRGRGASFCSGADLAWMQQSSGADNSIASEHSRLLATCFQTIHASQKPCLALVHGGVHAGAVGLMCACDIAVAIGETLFSVPETRIGLVPATILPYLLTRLNQHTSKTLIYLAKKVDAAKALEIGLVDDIFSDDEAEIKTKALLNDLLKASPNALAEAKALIHFCVDKPIDQKLIDATIDTLTRVKTSEEEKEGLMARKEKREAAWVRKLE